MASRSLALIALVLSACGPASSRRTSAPEVASIGKARPLVVGRVDPEGRWVFFCQVRRDTDHNGKIWGGASNHGLVGDAFEPFLWRDGEETKLDDFLDATADGRWIAVRVRGKSWLLDVHTGTRTELGIAKPADRYSFAPRAEFDAKGERILFVREIDDGGEVVLRELASGTEKVLRAGKGELWRAWLDADGEHVWADVVVADTDGDGELAVPRADTNLVVGSCMSSAATSTWGGWYGDQPVRFAERDGALVERKGGLAFFDDGVLARADDGALVLQRAHDTAIVAPASCHATIAHLDRAHLRVFFVCESKVEETRTKVSEHAMSIDRWGALQRWENGVVTPLDVEVDAPAQDYVYPGSTVTTTRTGGQFDFTTGAEPIEARDTVLATYEDHGLVILHDGTPCLLELASRTRRCFAGEERIDPTFWQHDLRVAGPMVLSPIGDRRAALLDLAHARVLGFVDDRSRVHGLDARGRLLMGGAEEHGGVVQGPLRWDHSFLDKKMRGDGSKPTRR